MHKQITQMQKLDRLNRAIKRRLAKERTLAFKAKRQAKSFFTLELIAHGGK